MQNLPLEIPKLTRQRAHNDVFLIHNYFGISEQRKKLLKDICDLGADKPPLLFDFWFPVLRNWLRVERLSLPHKS